MNVSCGHRMAISSAQAGRVRMSFSSLPVMLRSSVLRTPPAQALHSRKLWWWSRRAYDWSLQLDEDLEERMQRHQKMLKHRYSKAVRRRAIWDREDLGSPSCWPFSRRWSRWADYKALSSGRHLHAEMGESEEHSQKNERPWKQWDRDFEKLKNKIDEVIDRDPYNTLFGRHLRSPPSANNSSWTSFSWIYGPSRSVNSSSSIIGSENSAQKPTHSIPIEGKSSSTSSKTIFSVAPSTEHIGRNRQTPESQAEYLYDPISMRKVLKPKETTTAASIPKKSLLETLLGEHGVEIPVKTYKPHTVYGFGVSGGSNTSSDKPGAVKGSKTSSKGFESSRLRELQALKAATLGTNIDTTAEYGGKYKIETDLESTNEPVKKRDRKSIGVNENAPLFAGTTYEDRADLSSAKIKAKNDWLLKEGFQTLPEALSLRSEAKDTQRYSSEGEGSIDDSKIQPSLDRIKASDVKARKDRQGSQRTPLESKLTKETTEDIDLLRASDVRAATRTARKTRQETQQDKTKARETLEADYSLREKQHSDNSDVLSDKSSSTTKRVTESLNNVWKHVKEYPQGIVAKTIRSMGIFNDNYKSYVRLDKPAQDLTEKLVFKDGSLSKIPSIYKKFSGSSTKSLQTFTPSQEVIDAENASKARTAAMKQLVENSKIQVAQEAQQAEDLAGQIRKAYETDYGTINIDHRQQTTLPPAANDVAIANRQESPESAPHPLRTASSKPGVTRDLVIESHVTEFEPKLAKLVDEAKSARKMIHETRLQIMAIRSQRPQTYWNAQPIDALVSNGAETSSSADVQGHSKADVLSKTEPTSITPSRTKIGNDATDKPHLVSTEAAGTPMAADGKLDLSTTATYVILAYDSSTQSVRKSPVNSSIATYEARTVNAALILAKLDNAAKFLPYFADLSSQGYEIVSGGGDILVFKKVHTATPVVDRNKIAADEASAQPINDIGVEKKAATVLDEIPASGPTTGPAAPTAPPSVFSKMDGPKVRRQEDVFSATKSSRVSNHDDFSGARQEREGTHKPDSLWTRFKRGVKRVVLTAAAMGGVAYAIGAVAESLGAQQAELSQVGQIQKGRPGIYSTERSR